MNILVTGGCSFIGSHLVDALVKRGWNVIVADDLSRGLAENIDTNLCDLHVGDLHNRDFLDYILDRYDIQGIFHLAAAHGGRGYIDSMPVECLRNLALDQVVFDRAIKYGVEKIVYASSACVYPLHLQDYGSHIKLSESMATDKLISCDSHYGFYKAMGEMSLRACYRQYGLKSASVRIMSCYGPRALEGHVIPALIAKALAKVDPFTIWGSGLQRRNFTYVTDTVNALILAYNNINDGSAINAGRDDSLSINDLMEIIFNYLNWRPHRIIRDEKKPVGSKVRSADLSLARGRYNWEPKVSYEQGIIQTIDWCISQGWPLYDWESRV